MSEVLSGVLSEKAFNKVLSIIKVLEKKGYITTREAGERCGKSIATARRYLSILTSTKLIIAEGNTNNSEYRIDKDIFISHQVKE